LRNRSGNHLAHAARALDEAREKIGTQTTTVATSKVSRRY
jgi:hypothetical protein